MIPLRSALPVPTSTRGSLGIGSRLGFSAGFAEQASALFSEPETIQNLVTKRAANFVHKCHFDV
jgi:hypothetical protein